MLAIPNARSISYLNELIKRECLPSFVCLLKPDSMTPGQKSFEENAVFVSILNENRIEFETFDTMNINDPQIVDCLKKRKENIIIYSGPGGALLKEDLLSIGKEYVHVHPGKLPEFRGSTTIYYHVLSGVKPVATAIFLRSAIDTGPILKEKEFDFPINEDIDYEYDPRIRAEVLGDLIEEYSKKGSFGTKEQSKSNGETYYIMHPMLRHIARLSFEK